ncbi:MAG: copper homeostasis protein CutC [Bacteroidales bacterium]|jgi:copper homeostasis protein|nr:copper homeostasis protein CutC [Bacteroidales bacterium]
MNKEKKEIIIECCLSSLDAALIAQEKGCNRIELCSSLNMGGITPSYGLIKLCKENLNIDTMVMIRPREGDFLYSENEIKTMLLDIEYCKKVGVKGVVFGLLKENGEIDVEKTKCLIEAAQDMDVCFHRAIDLTRDYFEAFSQISSLGCKRVLTSGGKNKAIDAIDNLRKVNSIYGKKIEIMAGSGISCSNIEEIYHRTGVKNFHLSAKTITKSLMQYHNDEVKMGGNIAMDEYSMFFIDEKQLMDIKKVASNLP